MELGASVQSCRLLIDEPAAGDWNMAADEFLLESAWRFDQLALRFYGWSQPTVSLGYFQAAQERLTHAASRDCAWVRRSSGGGAIIHDRETTYSLAAPATWDGSRQPILLYESVHARIVETLAEFGITAGISRGTSGSAIDSNEYLCFRRRAEGDVVLAGHKIVGSAQRRRHGAILQHGGILWETSNSSPELAGIREISGLEIPRAQFLRQLLERLSGHFEWRFEPANWTKSERAAIEALRVAKFAHPEWSERR